MAVLAIAVVLVSWLLTYAVFKSKYQDTVWFIVGLQFLLLIAVATLFFMRLK